MCDATPDGFATVTLLADVESPRSCAVVIWACANVDARAIDQVDAWLESPSVTLLGTGGTIASRLDYRTGAVIPAFTPGELYGAVPELADICNLTTKKLFGVFSENMAKEQYVALAEAVGREIESGVDGIVIGHGTDTMGHTAAILSFMVQDPPVPIVMVGSQRSSDRPSSDAALNLIHAVHAAGRGDVAEVVICMFGPTSDQYALLHRGTRCRKMHSSYRSTFRTIGATPLAMVSRQKNETGEYFTYLSDDFLRRDKSRKPIINPSFEEKVTIQYYYPNFNSDIIDSLSAMGYRGLVIAGTGLGHINKPLYAAVGRAIEKGMTVVMTVQTIWGYAQMYVYDTGRDLLKLAIRHYNGAAQLRPDSPWIVRNLGLAYASLEQWDKAVQAYSKALALIPNDPELLTDAAVAQQRSGRAEEAAMLYEAALHTVDSAAEKERVHSKMRGTITRLKSAIPAEMVGRLNSDSAK